MKALLTFFLFLFSFATIGQDEYSRLFHDNVTTIQWSCYVTYLPSGHSENIILKATPKKLKAEYQTIKWRKRYRRLIKKKIRISADEFVNFQQRYHELNQDSISIILSNHDKEILRELIVDTTYAGEPLYKLSEDQLENYLKKEFLTIDFSIFEMDRLGFLFHGTVIDGIPFKFTQQVITSKKDTTSLSYRGNLLGSERYRDLDQYIRFNLLVNSTNLFDQLPLEGYFSRERLLSSLLKYLEGKEGQLVFKPFELKLEE